MSADDEDLPRNRKPPPKDLSPLSVTELENYIGELEAEIARAKAEIDAKKGHRSGAEGLFKR